ncbi:dynein heavy chain 2, axonemal [Orussus abietinus]|uniref:dynein heavy chain 2, axonemal n=1 Tax=Orussus abietinus TaxID=222816 RepID=UPI000C715BBD|nr:dynein heavy chain 2, axonemal [Orussus abietinus]
MTTLFNLKETDWNEECLSTMSEFLYQPEAIVICLYFDGDELVSELSFPMKPIHELTYFIKEPYEHLTVENFHENIVFGSINDHVESSILNIVEHLLAPIFFRIYSWPDSILSKTVIILIIMDSTEINIVVIYLIQTIFVACLRTYAKANFWANVHNFLCTLTDLTYKMLGLTVIYLPLEAYDLTPDEASTDKELVKRFESVVMHWTRQIRVALGDQDQATSRELLRLTDEYEFWLYRYDNLCGLNSQLQNSIVKHVVEISTSTQSTYVRQFLTLNEEIDQGMKVAKSNIEILGILRESCGKLDACSSPNEISKYLPEIIQLLRVIWLNSPFFNNAEKMSSLFVTLSNQVVVLCKKFIDLREMFYGRTRKCMQILKQCIDACKEYKRIYNEISLAHNTLTDTYWVLDSELIFRHVDVFITRCENVIEICQAMIDFARMDDTTIIPKPIFGGTKGIEYERVCQKVERLFLESLRKIEANSQKIFDVHQPTWYDDMFRFREEAKDLEIILENLMTSVFQDMNNIQEGINHLYGFYNFMGRKTLRTLFDSKITLIWKMFGEEIQKTKQEVLDEYEEYSSTAPYYSGRAQNLRLKIYRLEAMKKTVDEAKWMFPCNMAEEVYLQHKILVASIEDSISDLYYKWINDTGENPVDRLDRFLMRRSSVTPEFIECNIDQSIIQICKEASYWINLGFNVPVHIQVVHGKWDTLQFVYESVLTVVLSYNKIIDALSKQERELFRDLIRLVDRKIKVGLTRFTWNSEFIDAFIQDCCNQTANLQEFLDTYKISNFEIVKVCERICDRPMIRIRPNYAYRLKELEMELRNEREAVIQDIIKDYSTIMQFVMVVYEGFQPVLEDSIVEWKNYLSNLDKLLEEAFRLCLKNSISVIYEAMHGDGTTAPSPILFVEVDLVNNKISFEPALSEIGKLVAGVLEDLVEPLKRIPRVMQKFRLEDSESKSFSQVYVEDEEFKRLQQMLNNEVGYCHAQVQNYLKTWEPFRDMWEINKDIYIQRYEKLKPTVASFDADIGRYADTANNVQMQETVSTVYFLDINSDKLKTAIIEQCVEWQKRLTGLLLRLTDSKIMHIYKYIAENTKNLSTEPTDLATMQTAMQLFDRLQTEAQEHEEDFPKIREQFQILEKYQVPMTFEFKRRVRDIESSWNVYLELLAASEILLLEKKEQFKKQLLNVAALLTSDMVNLMNSFYENGPFTSDWKSDDALSWIDDFRMEIRNLRERETQLKADLVIFGISQSDSPELAKLEKDLRPIEHVWRTAKEWEDAWESYKHGHFWTIEMADMDSTANVLFRKLTKLSKELKEKNWEIVETMRTRLDKFRRTLPLINDLKNHAMRDRHWDKVKQVIGREFDHSSDDFTLNAIADMQMQNYAEQIADISNAATMELGIEMGLKEIAEVWKRMPLDMILHKDRGFFELKSVEDITQALEAHQVQLTVMKATRFVEPFSQDVDYWERALSTVNEVLEMILVVQKAYTYLHDIFNAEDIRKQLPKETDDFDKLSLEWRKITARMAMSSLAMDATHNPPNLLELLNKLNDSLEEIQRALEQYLETKRHIFPRFYFISNDDLLEILANSKKPERVQPHIKKLFEGMKMLKIMKTSSGKHSAEGMLSSEGEYVEFLKPVMLEGQVEIYLCHVETAMRNCLREVLRQCKAALRKMLAKRDKWVKEWQSQPGITSSQIQWTNDCTRTLLQCKLMDSKKPLRKLRKKQNQALSKYSETIRSQLNRLQRLKFKAIVVIEIHARDVIEKLYKINCRDVSSFDWLSQLRFYWERDTDDCIVRQTNTYFVYGYEYLGNSERLVITPLTDRCYITLTTALHLHRGGCPKGPAGTGKTETVKDLGKALGFNVIVQNCSEGLDYKSMGRLFSGLAQTGAWGCFDEFNRINIEVLSVVAQQILSILTALAQKLTKFAFEGCEISLVHTCGIFITMNPGYAGRTELPDNLKSMFRPISMMAPDSSMIAEISLFGEGFQNTRSLARKVYTLYTLAQQQLSKQFHYDFGLRGIVTLTRYAGKKRRLYPHLSDEEVVLLAMKDMNVAKLTSEDLPLFNGITASLFPGIDLPTVDYEQLISYITREATQLNLQPIPLIITKVIQLYETKTSRHSTMIVGESNTAKTVTWETLKNTLTTMKKNKEAGYNAVHVYPINPKALNLSELYGEYNLATGEWLDGVISSIMRIVCAEETPDEKWILFDGPIDAVWIENMNSVMDDNKILTLINNDRITMPEQVSLLFEVENLAAASPATVSRAGMVYNDYKDIGWRPLVNSWLQAYKNEPRLANELNGLFDRYVNPILEFKQQNCEETIPVPELNAVESLCKLLKIFITSENGVEVGEDQDSFSAMCKLWFLFCSVWSICASVNEDSRFKVDTYLREIEGSYPLKDTVYEYYVDVRKRSFASWEEKLQQSWKFQPGIPFYKIFVPTVDTERYISLVNALVAKGYPTLLVGPVGTGKTSIAQAVLDSANREKYSILVVNMSAQTSSKNVQDCIESKVEKRTKGVYIPIGGKIMITFMDDLNMPMKDEYGSQPPLELLRQWIGYGFWYDRRKYGRVYVQRMQLIAGMGPPGGGRNTISDRLLTRFNVINMTLPVDKQITRIYGTMLNQRLFDFHPEVKGMSSDLVSATIRMYNNVILKMRPTPLKMHYLFNLRDISKIFQGLLRSHKDYHDSKQVFLRLWAHESFRVFCDRLIDEKDKEWFIGQINEQLGKYFETTYHSLCPDKRSPIFGSFMNAWNIYEDLTDIPALRRYIETQVEEHNSSPGAVYLDLIPFQDAIEHICRIVRVISQPRGHMLLIGIGGSGRQTAGKIAAYICEGNVFQIEVTKHYRVMEFREDLKRLYTMAGVNNQLTDFIFNDSQVAEEQFLEIINTILSTGEVTNLYKDEEMEDIRNILAKEILGPKSNALPSIEVVHAFLIERARSNMHIFLCMSPLGDAFRNRLRQYPALINCTTIDWFHEWPKDALLEVGNKFLQDLNLIITITGENIVEPRRSATAIPILPLQERMREGIASLFALIHSSVSQFSKRMKIEKKRHNYVTPTNFLELVAGYKRMLSEKRQELADQAKKLRNGLFKIDDTREKVNEMAAELEVTQEQVHQSTRECEEFLITIVNQRRDADETQKMVTARSIRIEEESIECKKLEEIARADLAAAEPALEEAMKALDALNKKDLTEIKSFTRPPMKVEMVMEAVMILKNSEPSWAESKRQLGDVNFLNTLRDFDKDHISDKTLKTISKYTSNPEFDPVKVGLVSIAAKSLCMWVIAIEQYGKLYRIIAPKRERLEQALISLRQKEAALAEAKEQLQKLRDELLRLQQMYDAKMKEKNDLISLAKLLKLKLERAAMLVDGLSSERIRWENSIHSLDELFNWLPGDCLISTAFLSYLGPFDTGYRLELFDIWTAEIKEKEIPASPDLDVIDFLSDSTTIREWNIQGLPSDEFSTENAIIIMRGSRWPLVIDPQSQAVKWIRNMESKNNLDIIDFGQPDFMRTLELAIQFGKPVLLQNVGETLDPALNPILQKSFIKSGDEVLIKIQDKMISYNEQFRLFITTKLPNPHYSPEISTKTTLCNFTIKEQGLEAQLLGIVVRKEKPRLEEQKDNLVVTIATGKRTLKELEEKILYLLSVSSGSLLDDLDLLNTLQTSKETGKTIEESLVTSEETEKEIDQAREEYRPCATRASILFFVLNDMSLIDPMYQFSLHAYILLFMVSIDKSPRHAKLSERIDALNDYHTYAVYRNTCRGLFEQHKLLFSFHMCIKIMEAQGKIVHTEYDFLLKGGIVLNRENQPDKPVSWLPDEIWDNITELDKLAGFHGIVSSFEQFSRDWHVWFIQTEPEAVPLIGEWEENCNEFQKLLVVRSCRLDRMSFCLTTYIVHNLGQRFVEPPVLDIKAVLDDSVAQTPLIFVLSPGVDPTGSLMQLAQNQNMAKKFMILSLGQGQAPIATRMIQIGEKEGNWVFLANCHLSISWMPKLDKIVQVLSNNKNINPQFRLWLSSSPTPQFPIAILQAGIKITTEPPKGLKANMKRLYSLITESQFDAPIEKSKYKKLLFALVFFHSILLERKKFQQLGWNVIYSFNDSDFEVSQNILRVYLDEYPVTPWDSLKYLIAGVCYGGHVTDEWDRRLLMTYIQQYLTEKALDTPFYRLSSLTTYYIPRDGSLESYRDFINMLPNTDQPEAFGQHSNADITSLIKETRDMFATLMCLRVQASVDDAGSSKEDKVTLMAEDILSKLPNSINVQTTELLIGAEKTPLDVVLLQEIRRYNNLLHKTHSSLEDLQRGIKGLVMMSSELEEIFTSIYEGRVPSFWLSAYPSLKLLGSWTRDLIKRVEYFARWAETIHPPTLFWLTAYTFPTGLLTAVLQTSAKLWGVAIDSLSWEFSVLEVEEHTIKEPPDDGMYVRSVFLEGAGWDKKHGELTEPSPMQLISDMPVIHFKPVENVKKRVKGLYVCPCYYYPQRSGDGGRPSFVVAVDLKAGAHGADFWIKRGAALLLSLTE